MSLRYEIEAQGYYVVANRFVQKFTSYLTPTNTKNPPDGVPAMVLDYFPFNFSDKWTILAVAALAPEVDPAVRGMRGSRISAINIGMRIYALSLKPKGSDMKYEDGRQSANKATSMVWSNWFAAFEADAELWPYNISFAVDLGDQDRAGGYLRQPDRPEQVLWVHSTTARIAT